MRIVSKGSKNYVVQISKKEMAKKPMTKILSEKFGGKWKFEIGSHQWRCDDGRYAHYVLTGTDYDGEYTGESRLCIYGGKNGPIWF